MQHCLGSVIVGVTEITRAAGQWALCRNAVCHGCRKGMGLGPCPSCVAVSHCGLKTNAGTELDLTGSVRAGEVAEVGIVNAGVKAHEIHPVKRIEEVTTER